MTVERGEIEALVRKVVQRTLGGSGDTLRRPVLDEAKVYNTSPGSTLTIDPDTLVTPLARQIALERKIALTVRPAAPDVSATRTKGLPRVAIGADHGGYELKEALKAMLAADYELVDCGTHSQDPVDYPDIAVAVARLVAGSDTWRGIIIDGAGIGSCMVANKVRGVRAAMCYDQATAVNSREHNNANVLTLGAGLIGPNLAQQIVRVWLATEFSGGRHAVRVNKINALDGSRPTVVGADPAREKMSTPRPPAY
jgi:ribose 5-phosphate isomerase B